MPAPVPHRSIDPFRPSPRPPHRYKVEEEMGMHDAERDFIESIEDLADLSPREAARVAEAHVAALPTDAPLRASIEGLLHRLHIQGEESEEAAAIAVEVLPSPLPTPSGKKAEPGPDHDLE